MRFTGPCKRELLRSRVKTWINRLTTTIKYKLVCWFLVANKCKHKCQLTLLNQEKQINLVPLYVSVIIALWAFWQFVICLRCWKQTSEVCLCVFLIDMWSAITHLAWKETLSALQMKNGNIFCQVYLVIHIRLNQWCSGRKVRTFILILPVDHMNLPPHVITILTPIVVTLYEITIASYSDFISCSCVQQSSGKYKKGILI